MVHTHKPHNNSKKRKTSRTSTHGGQIKMAIRNINMPVTDSEYERLLERKGSQTWREFLLEDKIL